MKVKELIKKLEVLNQEMEVVTRDYEYSVYDPIWKVEEVTAFAEKDIETLQTSISLKNGVYTKAIKVYCLD